MKQLLFFILFLISISKLYAQVIDFNRTKEFSIQSEILNEERIVTVYLPQSYNFTEQNYPVLYLLDGKAHFQHTISAIDFLVNQSFIPQTIVVSIHNVDRTRDFSPIHVKHRPTTGGAPQFLKFIENELIQFIDNEFRTSKYRCIVGHSFGGTFISYALIEKPDLFNGFIGLSPYLHYADNWVIEEAKQNLQTKFKEEKRYYITVGNESSYFSPLEEFTQLLNKTDETFKFKYRIQKTESHMTIPYIGLYNGLRFLFEEWQLPEPIFTKGLKAIDNHYKEISNKFGLDVTTPEWVINRLGYKHLQFNDIESAIKVFKINVERNPLSPNTYDSLGEAYEKSNQQKLAYKNYKKAYELGIEQNDRNTSIFKQNMKRMKTK